MTLYQQALALHAEHGHASISLVQRKLRCGYAEAARLVARIEAKEVAAAKSEAK